MALEEESLLPPTALEKVLASEAVRDCPYARATVHSWLKWIAFFSLFMLMDGNWLKWIEMAHCFMLILPAKQGNSKHLSA